jgi:type IV pilus assembly protein PilC
MENVVKDAELAVNEGRRMSEALRQHEIVSPLVLRMMVVGEETGKLDEALRHVSERFDSEIPRRIKRAFGVMEPAIILILISIVGLVAGAVFLPMFSLMSGVGG